MVRTKKIWRQKTTTAKEMASLAGKFEDSRKSNAKLFGMNATVMKDTANVARFNRWAQKVAMPEKFRWMLSLAKTALDRRRLRCPGEANTRPIHRCIRFGMGRSTVEERQAAANGERRFLATDTRTAHNRQGDGGSCVGDSTAVAPPGRVPPDFALGRQHGCPVLDEGIATRAADSPRATHSGPLGEVGHSPESGLHSGVDNVADTPSRLPATVRGVVTALESDTVGDQEVPNEVRGNGLDMAHTGLAPDLPGAQPISQRTRSKVPRVAAGLAFRDLVALGNQVDERSVAGPAAAPSAAREEVAVHSPTAMDIARQYDCGPTDRSRRIAELDIPKEEAEAARKTIKRSSARAKYDSYFDVAPIYAAAVELLEQRPLQEAVLRQAVVVLLRLTTLMRAGDLERTLPRIFHDNGIDFIHAVAKGGVCRSFAITGNTLRATKMYIDRIKKPPRAPIPCALICYLKTGDPLGSEAISKTALHLMEKCGVDARAGGRQGGGAGQGRLGYRGVVHPQLRPLAQPH
eukprot:TRINITY_DN22981_c0_g2_i7.p1 TRINITY_DN22981_c0_g2~~TRINITY_DN22981_c0_g2_i7.p1  ORF type:complete len:519 (-),score=49.15 TRINITY_DN22981_c0_g2_i7:642-2198(-)